MKGALTEIQRLAIGIAVISQTASWGAAIPKAMIDRRRGKAERLVGYQSKDKSAFE